MNVTFSCPKCEQASRVELAAGQPSIACSHCDQRLAIPAAAFDEGSIRRCVVCPSTELFVRKDFPQRLGVGIVVVGFAISCITWGLYLPQWTFAVLFATALVDLGLYAVVGNSVMCYRCAAEYRGLENPREFSPFNLETHERYRQQNARQKQAQQQASRQQAAQQADREQADREQADREQAQASSGSQCDVGHRRHEPDPAGAS